MNKAGQTNIAGEKLRINTYVCTRVHDNISRGQKCLQEPPLWAISVSFESAITQSVNGKGVFVSLIANSANKGDQRDHDGITSELRECGNGSLPVRLFES
jgi:hypothetical protein